MGQSVSKHGLHLAAGVSQCVSPKPLGCSSRHRTSVSLSSIVGSVEVPPEAPDTTRATGSQARKLAAATVATVGAAALPKPKRWRRAAAKAKQPAVPPRCPPLEPPDPQDYPPELDAKAAKVSDLLARHVKSVDMQIAGSPEIVGYRHRVNFLLRHGAEGQVDFAVFDHSTSDWVAIQQYPIASACINRLMLDLRAAFARNARLRDEAFQVQLVSNTEGEVLVCIMYHRRLNEEEDRSMAGYLAEEIGAKTVILRARKQRLAARRRRDYLVQTNVISDRAYQQYLMDDVFFQANLQLNREMQRWVVAQTRLEQAPCDRDLLELFCGNGNFTLPASANFRTVLATELERRSVDAAMRCAEQAGLGNVAFQRLDAEQAGSLVANAGGGARSPVSSGHLAVEEAWADNLNTGSGHADENGAAPCERQYDFGMLLVDPPRAGLGETSLKIARGFDNVLYVSCNPETLATDLDQLPDHEVVCACLFDQFPWTDHVEVGVKLVRVGGSRPT